MVLKRCIERENQRKPANPGFSICSFGLCGAIQMLFFIIMLLFIIFGISIEEKC